MNLSKLYKSNVSVPLEIELIEEVDNISSEQKMSRAAYIRLAVKEKIKKDKKEF